MKTRNKIVALVEIAVVLCSMFLVALPAIAAEQETQKVSASEVTAASEDDFILEIYGNANEDECIDMRDYTYTARIICWLEEETTFADANYDGRISVADMTQTGLIILGRESELTFVDYYGEAVTVSKPITRVVVPYTEQADLLRALNAADKIVGVPERIKDEKAYYPELSKLPSIGTVFEPDYELVLSLNPDVFLVYYPLWVDCEKLPGITCIFLGYEAFHPENFAQTVTKFGYIFDNEEEAEQYIDWNMGWINEIKSRTEGLPEDKKPRVWRFWWYPEGSYDWSHTYGDRDIIAGGKNIAESLPEYTKVDIEWVAEQNPEIIVAHAPQDICGYGYDDASEMAAVREDIMNRAGLSTTIAVKNGDVYLIDNKHFMCTNTGYAISIAYMAKWFHPGLFEDLDPQAIHQEYITEFQRLDYDVSEHGVFVYHSELYPDGR